MIENHSHPCIRNRNVVVRPSAPSVPPYQAGTPSPVPDDTPDFPPAPVVVISKPVEVPSPPPVPAPKKFIDVPKFVTAIITNYKTKGLVKQALNTFIEHYSDVKILLIDNGSDDSSTEYVKKAGEAYPTVISLLHEHNLGHGPAMDNAIRLATTRYVFTMDSDCIVRGGEFLEKMVNHFQIDDNLYALGWLRYVDPISGVPANKSEGFLRYVHPHAALYDRDKYLTLPPFAHHGAPCTANMREAKKRGYGVKGFPIDHYVHHLIAGTRRMYGGKWDPRPGEKKQSWREGRVFPI